MGSAAETARDTAAVLCGEAGGRKLGVLQVRLYRPFSADAFPGGACPTTVEAVAVLEHTKEPGATGEPLYLDVVTTLAQAVADGPARRSCRSVIGGRYGLSSKDFTPGHGQGRIRRTEQADAEEQLHRRHHRRRLRTPAWMSIRAS